MTFRQQATLILLEKYADKLFDNEFRMIASSAALEPPALLVAYIDELVDELCRTGQEGPGE